MSLCHHKDSYHLHISHLRLDISKILKSKYLSKVIGENILVFSTSPVQVFMVFNW